MRIALIVVGLLVSLAAQPQDIYRWVDKDGTVHYADQPGAPDATTVEYTGYSRGRGSGAGSPAPSYRREPPQFTERPPYGSLSITSPTPDQAFFGGDARVAVTVALDTELRDGDELLILVDGNRVPGVSGFGVTTGALTRGTHFLRAAVVDPAGKIVITSPQITFHVRQASIATPPVGPRIPPPQRPSPPAS